jgi:hypothetical protein
MRPSIALALLALGCSSPVLPAATCDSRTAGGFMSSCPGPAGESGMACMFDDGRVCVASGTGPGRPTYLCPTVGGQVGCTETGTGMHGVGVCIPIERWSALSAAGSMPGGVPCE